MTTLYQSENIRSINPLVSSAMKATQYADDTCAFRHSERMHYFVKGDDDESDNEQGEKVVSLPVPTYLDIRHTYSSELLFTIVSALLFQLLILQKRAEMFLRQF